MRRESARKCQKERLSCPQCAQGAHELKKVGPVKTMDMRHADGNSAKLLVQCLQREGVANRYIVRCQVRRAAWLAPLETRHRIGPLC